MICRKVEKYPLRHGFSLVELLVAVAVFSIMSALAYGGLNSIARTRGELAKQEDAFRDLMRAVTSLDRDLRQAVARPVSGSVGQTLPAFSGSAAGLEFTRLGFANPQAEPRANLERVLYELDAGSLKRGSFPVLDRAPGTAPQITTLRSGVSDFRLRYLDISNRWSEVWPLPQAPPGANPLPRAVQWHLQTRDYGEIVRVIELVSASPPPPTTPPPASSPPPGAAK